MRVRQVQAHEVRRRHLRQVRRGGDPGARASRADGPHRAGLAGLARVVLQGAAEPDRPAPRHVAARAGEDPLLRGVRLSSSRGSTGIKKKDLVARGQGPQAPRGARPRLAQGGHGRRGDPRAAAGHGPRLAGPRSARPDARRDLGAEAQEDRQAPESHRGVPEVRQPAGVDDPRSRPGHPAGAAPAGAARRRALRDLRPQRSVPPRDQPEQPAEAADGPQGARRSSSATKSGCCRRPSTRCSTTAAAAA